MIIHTSFTVSQTTTTTTLRSHFGSSRDRLLGSQLGFVVFVGRGSSAFLCTGSLLVKRFDLRSVQWNGAVIVRCAKFEGFWVWRSGAVCRDVRFDACDACRVCWCCDLFGPLLPVVFSFIRSCGKEGWPRCLGLRVVSLTLEPKQQLPRLWLSSLSTLLGVR